MARLRETRPIQGLSCGELLEPRSQILQRPDLQRVISVHIKTALAPVSRASPITGLATRNCHLSVGGQQWDSAEEGNQCWPNVGHLLMVLLTCPLKILERPEIVSRHL